jgi:hypothetical protein
MIYSWFTVSSIYSAKQNTPQLAAWVPSMWQNLTRRGNFRNTPSACGGDRDFQGFASLLDGFNDHLWLFQVEVVMALIVYPQGQG